VAVTSGRSRVGTRFGKYELLTLLGRGGMGEVYEARDTQKGRIVALKILLEQYAQDPGYRDRFTREANAAASLQEPHVVPIHDWGEIDGNLYIDMRLIRGTDLRKLCARGPLDPSRAINVISQVASALDAAHAEGLIHRDVKPENIVVSGDDFAHLLDFGIAERVGDTHLTQAGMTVGSWAYMAPERLSGDQATHAVDIYSLACVLYETLTGTRPFAIDSMQQIINAHLQSPPPQASAMSTRIPRALDAVIERGMAKEPDDRYGSAGALARAAQRAISTPDECDRNATVAAPHVNFPTEQHTRRAPAPQVPSTPTPASVAAQRSGVSKTLIVGIAACAALFLATAGIAVGMIVARSTDSSNQENAQNPSLTRLPAPDRPLVTGQRPTIQDKPSAAPRTPVAPPAVTGIDGLGQRCDSGIRVLGTPGAGSHAVRGTTETSCRFVENVLTAYWDAGGPNASPRMISAAGGVPCNPRRARCSGDFYILECTPFDAGDWVTCRGGVNAVVHIY
jgi:serine/threonine protein kinase